MEARGSKYWELLKPSIMVSFLLTYYFSILYMIVINVIIILQVRIRWHWNLRFKGLITTKAVIIKTYFH